MDLDHNILPNKSLVRRGRIVDLRQANVYARVVAEYVGCNLKIVYLREKKFRKHSEAGLVDHRKNNHRLRTTNNKEDLLLIGTSMHNSFLPLKEILRLCNLNLSKWSTARCFKANDHVSACPAKKPELTDAHRVIRGNTP